MTRNLFTLLILTSTFFALAQNNKIQSGPMVGYAEMKEVLLWVQTTDACKVQFEYWEKGSSAKLKTDELTTQKNNGFTAKLIADKVLPGKEYEYMVIVDGKSVKLPYPTEFKSLPLWQYRTDPPQFKLAIGSCFYINDVPYDRPGKPYGQHHEVIEQIYKQDPDLMLWLGDNYYYREADYNTRTGMLYRATDTRSEESLQSLLASVSQYAIWDDHDYGPNDANKSFIHKNDALDVFASFWGNPTYGFYDESCATTQFDWGDAQFFLLDNRWFRDANGISGDTADYFGTKQIDWLINSLKASRAHFKIIASGGQILNPAKVFENYANYESERSYFLQRIKEEDIHGVVFLSGDRHHSDLIELKRENDYTLYDITVSPLSAGAGTPVKEEGEGIVEGTIVSEQNFGIIEFSGPYRERQMKVTVYNYEGKTMWEKVIKAEDLK